MTKYPALPSFLRDWPEFKLSDEHWSRLKQLGNLPDAARSLLTMQIGNARCDLHDYSQKPPNKVVRSELGKIKKRSIGKPIGFSPHPRVRALLAGQAWLDPLHGDGDIRRVHEFAAIPGGEKIAHRDIRKWAADALACGSGIRSLDRPKGGFGNPAEKRFLQALILSWVRVPGASMANWADENKGPPLTKFVRDALYIAGVRYAGRKLSMASVKRRIALALKTRTEWLD